MLKVRQFSKLLTSSPVKTYFGTINENTSRDFRLRERSRIPGNFYSCKSKDDRRCKVCDRKKEEPSIQSHPSSTTCPDKPQGNSKKCYVVDPNPCRPPPYGYPSKIPYIHECPKLNLMSDSPGPKCAREKKGRTSIWKRKKSLMLGMLFTEVTLGTLMYIHPTQYKKTVLSSEKIGKGNTKRMIIKYPADSAKISKYVPYLLTGGGTAFHAINPLI